MIKEYVSYLKDNPNGYWFKRKLYGWGWTPATWQGWFAIGVYVLLILGLGFFPITRGFRARLNQARRNGPVVSTNAHAQTGRNISGHGSK